MKKKKKVLLSCNDCQMPVSNVSVSSLSQCKIQKSERN